MLRELWAWVVSSYRRHGFVGAVVASIGRCPTIVAMITDPLFDRRRGTDTGGIVELERLAIDSPNRARGIRYEVTRAPAFRELLRRVPLPRDVGFVDFGCGKGRVLMLAAEAGFRDVVGIDFSPELCAVAEANVARRRPSGGAKVRVVHADAADVEIEDHVGVFYMYNPFDDVVLRQVLSNIERSLARRPRRAYLIYCNPVHRDVIERSPKWGITAEHAIGGRRFAVYEAR